MSILNGPRINFWGGIEVDVSVPNNTANYPINSQGKLAEDGESNAIFDPKTATLTNFVYANNITDEQIISTLRLPAFHNKTPYFSQGGWNIYGQHSVVTNNVTISSVGDPGEVSETAALVDLPMYLLGSVNPVTGQLEGSPVMVDLNPLGAMYSQIVLGGLIIGDINSPLLHLQGDKIASNIGGYRGQDKIGLDKKLLNGISDSPGSSMYAGAWQVTFDKSEIVASAKSDDSSKNDAITAFLNTPGMKGVIINFSFFEMCPKFTSSKLESSYDHNENERNPSVGRIVGTIGIAFAGETAQNPDGRLLRDEKKNVTAYACTHTSDKVDYLSLNLLTSLTQQNFRDDRTGYATTPINPAIDAGPLTLCAGSHQLRSFSPNYIDYYKYGGIFDVPLNREQLKLAMSHQLSINSNLKTDSFCSTLIESTYRVYSSAINVYMGEKEGHLQTIDLVLRYLGQPVAEKTTVSVNRVDLDDFNNEDYLDQSVHQITFQAGQASASYTLTNKKGSDKVAGFEQVEFSCQGSNHVVNTRKYQYTDFGLQKGAIVTWEEAYNNALRYHYLNFLGMSNVFPLNFADTIIKNKEGIKIRTSSKYWPTSLYMPVVRSMSPSQIRLINAFSFGSPWDPDVEI